MGGGGGGLMLRLEELELREGRCTANTTLQLADSGHGQGEGIHYGRSTRLDFFVYTIALLLPPQYDIQNLKAVIDSSSFVPAWR